MYVVIIGGCLITQSHIYGVFFISELPLLTGLYVYQTGVSDWCKHINTSHKRYLTYKGRVVSL